MAKVLIVDDSQTETKRFTQFLDKHGHEVITADSGERGIEVAKAELPDLILMDVVMPGLNGFQATRRLTRDPSTKHIPIIIVTTKDQETDKVWGRRQGASAYLSKPVPEDLLMETIRQALDK
jgi:twitching motility two-component system response regulator PilH